MAGSAVVEAWAISACDALAFCSWLVPEPPGANMLPMEHADRVKASAPAPAMRPNCVALAAIFVSPLRTNCTVGGLERHENRRCAADGYACDILNEKLLHDAVVEDHGEAPEAPAAQIRTVDAQPEGVRERCIRVGDEVDPVQRIGAFRPGL